MTRSSLAPLLRLYPAAWRERYGEELDALLDEEPASFSLALDLLRGALDAHLHPQLSPSRALATATPKEGTHAVLKTLTCIANRHSPRALLGTSLAFTCAALVATWWPGAPEQVGQLLLLGAFPWALLAAELPGVWDTPQRTRHLASAAARALFVLALMSGALALGTLI